MIGGNYRVRRILWGAVCACLTLLMTGTAQAADPAIEAFERHIEPLLKGHCLKCHNPTDKQGGFDLTVQSRAWAGGESGAVIKPGQPADSLLLERVREGEMPPEGKLTAEEIAHLTSWIKSGAVYPHDISYEIKRAGKNFWTLKPPVRPAVPDVPDQAWPRQTLDRFVAAKLAEQKLSPSLEANRRTYLRRVKFDLLGLPPTPEELAAFENDKSPDAFEKLVDGYLMSPHYGERWGRHWLDVVRFGESHGYETNQLRYNAWPYRDYVIRSFNADKPYPRFILEQLAGDIVGAGDPDIEIATAYLVGGTHDVVGIQTVDGKLKQRNDDLDDMIATTGFTFLGLTLGCARCHDHKFDPISQKDYYGLQAVFAGVQHTERALKQADEPQRQQQAVEIQAQLSTLDRQLDQFEPLAAMGDSSAVQRPAATVRRNVERFTPITAKFIRFTIKATTGDSQPGIDELEIYTAEGSPRNVALASAGGLPSASSALPGYPIHQIPHINEGQWGNSHSWISNEAGQGWIQIELPQSQSIDRVVWGRDREEKFADRLATDYVLEVATTPGQWQTVATSRDRLPMGKTLPTPSATGPAAIERQALVKQREALVTRLTALSQPVTVYAGTFAQPGPTHLLQRGDGMLKGPEVPPAMVRAFGGEILDKNLPESERRLALARWIGSEQNPLTARVLVNRVWLYHFGQGIVHTPNDFGYNGGRPSNPELLDWLATEFVSKGWQWKPLHRMIVLSATYRQASQSRADAMASDAGNRFLWRFPPRRLEAEVIRDTVLAVTGKLDLTMGGPGYNIWEKNTNYVTVFKHREALGSDTFRRMVYQFKPRAQQDSTFGVFDCPDASFSMPRRFASTTALQAMNLLNGGFMLQQSQFLSDRLEQEAGPQVSAQVRRAFQIALLREPSAIELSAAEKLIATHGRPAFCRALLNSNELIFIH